ncbi:hypothetical protein [Aureimonas phyllosphaerae]|uniref:Uncharacterized protein n=1 Tax=Aureimonas phyllosphaerae TaxID=1166078 RepID=A0A7W6BTH6_9HYPH|nr:hypothetical protein [Aureimonas phyllosphaerae]MBB3937714.1 hypothetical protein [Aureimonas phyllosphaerae]MBB3961751.1 hypothetical protein [Aureimonas phyllosphaerae]SFF45363.1 hypothetical protein SAMN05216566_11452 [Aureimonas phyllosphaerae]
MITLEHLHAAAVKSCVRHNEKVQAKRREEVDGVAWALANKTSHSDSAWKERHAAELRLRAALAIEEVLAGLMREAEGSAR